ncbi:unspecified product [Leishmania tarentolae]|uniref:Unspecified product n=1 Tax=Leishmania tarentolae TaxID=5689 RepID=A0A640KVW3_LEITA|nr:unspecified product [Leishmania tarentolae]
MDSAPFEDQDLVMASRESAQHTINIQNEAYRQALSELAGELYVEAYKHSMQQALRKHAAQWKSSSSTGQGTEGTPIPQTR